MGLKMILKRYQTDINSMGHMNWATHAHEVIEMWTEEMDMEICCV